jgi:hypothetical protein
MSRLTDELIHLRVTLQPRKGPPIFKQVSLAQSLSLAQALSVIQRECHVQLDDADASASARDSLHLAGVVSGLSLSASASAASFSPLSGSAHHHQELELERGADLCERFETTCARLKAVEFDEGSRPLHVYGVASGDSLSVRQRSAKELKQRLKDAEKRAKASAALRAKAHGGANASELAAFSLVEKAGSVASQYANDSDDARALFGVPLWRTIERERALGRTGCAVPFVVEALCDLLRAKHLRESGIFRVSGQTAQVQALRNRLGRMTSLAKFDISLLVAEDAHTCANVLKQYIRELPEPLIPFEMFDAVVRLADVDDDERALQLRGAMAQLPLERYAVLRYLVEFLTDVHAFAAVNQMTSSNLSIVFGPALLHPEANQVASSAYLMAIPKVNQVVDAIIAHADFIFDIGLPQLLQVTPDQVRAAQAAIDEEKDKNRQRTASAPALKPQSPPAPAASQPNLGASSRTTTAAAAAAAVAAAGTPTSMPPSSARTKPMRFCEVCQQKRAKHVVNFKNGTRWMLCPDCLERARAQRESQKKNSGPQPTLAHQITLPANIGGNGGNLSAGAGGGNPLRALSQETPASPRFVEKPTASSPAAPAANVDAPAPPGGLCEACGKEPPKFRITLRNGTKKKVCATCIQQKQESKKARTDSAPEPPTSKSPAADAPKATAFVDDVPPPPPDDMDVPPSPPPLFDDGPPPPPVGEESFVAEVPPPPPDDDESAPQSTSVSLSGSGKVLKPSAALSASTAAATSSSLSAEEEEVKTWRLQSQKRQNRLAVARSRITSPVDV